jgi:hypothetical protein
MVVGASGADETNPARFGDLFRFDIQVVKHFHVIADKTYGRDDNA